MRWPWVGHEHLGRRFAASRDLYIRPSGRVGPAISLLPAAVGLTPDGGGHPWSIHTLTRRGRVEARADGISSRSNDVAIRYGLTLAADMNPLVVRNVEETKNLVFTALFDHRELPRRLSQEQLADVQERLLVAIEEHADDTWADFQNWFSGGHNNLVQTLARKAGYSPLPRDVVKAGLLTIGWQSYDYVSSYLATFAVAVRNALSEPLTAAERRQYDAMYLPQPYFGGLPLVLLMERTGLIGLVVRRLWESPEDESLIGSLHRLLAIYAELAPARRAADRRFKSLRRELSRRQSPEEGRASNDERAALRRLDWSRLEVTVRTLLRQRRAGCTECTDACTWNMDVESMDDDSLQLCVTCEDHDFKSECRFTFAELLAATTAAQPPETPS